MQPDRPSLHWPSFSFGCPASVTHSVSPSPQRPHLSLAAGPQTTASAPPGERQSSSLVRQYHLVLCPGGKLLLPDHQGPHLSPPTVSHRGQANNSHLPPRPVPFPNCQSEHPFMFCNDFVSCCYIRNFSDINNTLENSLGIFRKVKRMIQLCFPFGHTDPEELRAGP